MTGTDYALVLTAGERERYRLMARAAGAGEAAEWAAAGIRPGARIADVGCGPGAVLRLLAQRVGPDGRVDGVDADTGAVAAAAAEVADLPQARVVRGEAGATGLDPRSYDGVVCRHVLAHNGGREQEIVDHLVSLARPGGAVLLADADLDAAWLLPVDPDLADLQERYAALHEGRGNDLTVGRALGVLLERAGAEVELFRTGGPVLRMPPGMRPPAWAARAALLEAGLASTDDLVRWEAAFARSDAANPRPWAGLPLCIAVGRVPDRAGSRDAVDRQPGAERDRRAGERSGDGAP